jgi:hypothetical protein
MALFTSAIARGGVGLHGIVGNCIWDCRRHCPDDGVSELAARYDAEARDKQLEADVGAGKLDAFAREALREHKAGRTTSP